MSAAEHESGRVGLYGLGNVLCRDDGFGPAVVRRLDARYDFPDGVVVRDLGSPGLDLATHLAGFDAVLLVDTVLGGEAPGTLRVYGAGELVQRKRSGRLTQHEADLGEALALADLAGGAPRDVCLVGVVPENLGQGPGLSPAVRAACETACGIVLAELRRRGVVARARATPRPEETWWLEDAAEHAGVRGTREARP